MEGKRKTRGKQKIPMRLIQNLDDRYASFSKRRLGLFKKAGEISTLCNVDIGVLVFSPTNNPFSYFSPNMESVLARYVNPNLPLKMSTRIMDAHAQAQILVLNKNLDDAVEEKNALLKIDKRLKELDKARPKAWWEELPIHSLNKEQVSEWTDWFQKFKNVLELQVQQLQIEAFNQDQQLPQELSVSLDDYDIPPPFDGQFYIGDDTNMNQYSVPTMPLNLPGGGGGGQNYFGGGTGGGESSITNAHTNPNYFDQLLPSGMFDGSSSSNDVFIPDQSYSSYVSPGDDDLFGGGGGGGGELEQYAFPAQTMVQDGVGEIEQEFDDLLAAAAAAAANDDFFIPDPVYDQFPTGAQDLSAVEGTCHQGMEY